MNNVVLEFLFLAQLSRRPLNILFWQMQGYMQGEKRKKFQLVYLKHWNGVNYYSGFTFSWDQGNNSKLIKQIPLIMQRRSHKVTDGSMFYIHEHIIKILRHTIKFYILILHPTALNPPNKKIRLFNDCVCHTGFICLLLKQM